MNNLQAAPYGACCRVILIITTDSLAPTEQKGKYLTGRLYERTPLGVHCL